MIGTEDFSHIFNAFYIKWARHFHKLWHHTFQHRILRLKTLADRSLQNCLSRSLWSYLDKTQVFSNPFIEMYFRMILFFFIVQKWWLAHFKINFIILFTWRKRMDWVSGCWFGHNLFADCDLILQASSKCI